MEFLAQLEVVRSSLVGAASRLGVANYDCYGSIRVKNSLLVKDGVVDEAKAADSRGLTMRVWNGKGGIGIVSSNDLSPAGLELALKTALDSAQFIEATEVTEPPASAVGGQFLDPAVQTPFPTFAERAAQMAECEKSVLQQNPRLHSLTYNHLAQEKEAKFYLNSRDVFAVQTAATSGTYVSARLVEAGKTPRSGTDNASWKGFDMKPYLAVPAHAAQTALRHADYVRMPSQRIPVVFSGEAFLSLLYGFSSFFDAQSVLDLKSLTKAEDVGREGFASPLLTLRDDALHSSRASASRFDSEGTPTGPLLLLHGSRLKSLLHSTVTAKSFGVAPTGHGVMGTKVNVTCHYFCVDGASEPARTPVPYKRYVYVDGVHALHSGISPAQGSFSLPFEGWLMEQTPEGVKETSLDNQTVAGAFRDVLKAVEWLGEARVFSSGVCPDIGVGELMVAGENPSSS